MAFCEKCGHVLEPDALFCEKCGRPVPQEKNAAILCPECGAGNPADSAFCEKCGTPLNAATASPSSAAATAKTVVEAAKKVAAVVQTINTQAPNSIGEAVVASWKD